jgi:hypothetical protein
MRQNSPAGARAASRRTGDDGEGSVVSVLGEREVRARREGNESGESCGEARRGCSPIIGGRGGAGEEMPMGNGWGFTANAIDGRGGC